MARFLLVCLGGALGSGARYLVAIGAPQPTLIVNLIGSFAIAIVCELLPPTDLRLFLTMGVLGGFTTYSSFNQETLQMLRTQAWGSALVQMTATFAGCMAAGFLGIVVARALR